MNSKFIKILLVSVVLIALPLLLQGIGSAPGRILDNALLWVLLALGLNIVVGYTGLLDLGYIAFFAIGAYVYALLSSPHLTDNFPAIAAMAPNGLHVPFLIVILLAAVLAGVFGVLLGAPTLRLRGDYLAVVTLAFGEIIRVFLNNGDHLNGGEINWSNGAKGITGIDSLNIFGLDFGKNLTIGGFEIFSVSLYYYIFLVLVLFSILVSYRLQLSRVGRAWMAIREDEIAAKAMGINTRNFKLLAFGMGATFGGISGTMFAPFQGFISPESFGLMESVMIVAMVVLGGAGNLPGVIFGAVVLSILPEGLRYAAPYLRDWTGGRIDDSTLRQLLIALSMVVIMIKRPRGLWPAPEHGKSLSANKS